MARPGFELGLPVPAEDINSSDDGAVAAETRSYRFVLTFEVEPGHPAYDDPEWAADAAHGALTNEYGLRTIYADIADVSDKT